MVLDENALEAMLARQRRAEQDHRPAETVRTEENAEFEVYERPASEAPSRGTGLNRPAPPLQMDEGPAEDFEELPGRQAPTEYAPPPAFADERPPAPMPNQAPERPSVPRDVPAAPMPSEPPTYSPPAEPAPAEAAPRATPEPLPAAPVAPEPVAPVPEPAHPVPEPVQAPAQAAPVAPTPEPAVAPEPTAPVAPTPEPAAEPAEAPRRRPQVWPPIGASRTADAGDAPAPATPPTPAPSAPAPNAPAAPPVPEPTAPAAPTPGTHAPTPHAFSQQHVDGTGCSIAVVQALFNQELTDPMAQAAVERAAATGATISHHLTVPGVYDLPLTVQSLARRKDVDAVVVIGVVVQGETKHDELITFATAKSLQEISLATEVPVGLGIIGPGMTWRQAEARIGNGAHAVDAVVAQWSALRQH